MQDPQLGSPSTGSLGASQGSPGGTSGKEPACQLRRHKRPGFDPWVREDPLEEGMATPSSVLAGETLRQRSLGGSGSQDSKESDTT